MRLCTQAKDATLHQQELQEQISQAEAAGMCVCGMCWSLVRPHRSLALPPPLPQPHLLVPPKPCVDCRPAVIGATGQHVETFSALCQAVLPRDDWATVAAMHRNKNVNAMGSKADSVAAMDPPPESKAVQSRQQRDLGKLAALCIKQVVQLAKAGAQDMAGVLKLALRQRELKDFAPSLTGDVSSVRDPLFGTVAKAWRVAMRQKDGRTATQMLSLLVVQPLSDPQVQTICSAAVALEKGAQVRVRPSSRRSGRFSLFAVVEAVHADASGETYDLQFYKPCAAALKRRHATGQQAAAATAFDAAAPEEFWSVKDWTEAQAGRQELGVPGARIRHVDDVICTAYQLIKAKRHAKTQWPGAPVEQAVHSRVKIYGARRRQWVNFMRRSDNVRPAEASNRNTKRGIRFVLQQKMKRLHRKMVEESKALGLCVGG